MGDGTKEGDVVGWEGREGGEGGKEEERNSKEGFLSLTFFFVRSRRRVRPQNFMVPSQEGGTCNEYKDENMINGIPTFKTTEVSNKGEGNNNASSEREGHTFSFRPSIERLVYFSSLQSSRRYVCIF